MVADLTPALKLTAQQVHELIEAGDRSALAAFLARQHPADLADILETLPLDDRVLLFSLLETETAAEVLDETRTDTTVTLIESLPSERVADLLEELPADDAAEVLSELSDKQAAQIIARLEPEEAREIKTLLDYEEETAGRLMATNVVRLQAGWSAQHAIEHLRSVDPEAETLAYLYAVDSGEYLIGIVPIWELLTAASDRRIEDLMSREVVSVDVNTDQEEVARIVSQYDYYALPVVDAGGRLLGIITHDDVVDIIQEEFTEDVQRFGGSQPLETSYLSTGIITMVRKRVGWLLLLFVTATLTGTVMRLFENELETAVALSFFIPLLIGTGGNAGSQITSTMIRAIAMGEVRIADLWRVLGRELTTGALLGAAMGIAGLVRAVTWDTTLHVALTVALALFILVIWANLMGVLLPMVASRLRIDPAAISGPVMSTLVDATGLLIYFELARVILRL